MGQANIKGLAAAFVASAVRPHHAIRVKDDNGTFLITCPALPEVTTFAESADEVKRRAKDASRLGCLSKRIVKKVRATVCCCRLAVA